MQAGQGVYTLNTAAKLVQADRRAIQRWLFGYRHTRAVNGELRASHSEPLWDTQYASLELDEKVIGFQDLLELRVVSEFARHGVHLLVIRRCLDNARRLYENIPYPLTHKRFATDGKTIFHEALREGHEPEVVDLRDRQIVFRDIIKPSLFAGIDYDDAGNARRWYPEGGRKQNIVLDPAVQFGQPVTNTGHVPTDALYAAYEAEGEDAATVARIYELPTRQVEAAVAFERQLAQAA
jgi:uncharacterized protein (DUF433 family)